MFISNLEEVVALLRSKLPDYLNAVGVCKNPTKPFRCIAHSDKNPSMQLNPKTNHETAHCFSCNATIDIFNAANLVEGLPLTGTEWVTETIPTLAKKLQIDIALGQPSAIDIIRNELFSLARDIADLIQHPRNVATDYIQSRRWENQFEDCYTVEFTPLIEALTAKGWTLDQIHASNLITIKTKDDRHMPIVGKEKITWVIRDHLNRPVGFLTRNLQDTGPKYIHSAESPIFQKRETLFGLHLAMKTAKIAGLWIVEGAGDRSQLLRLGQTNVASACGTALTEQHFTMLKTLGVRDLYLCLDWDAPGQKAVELVAKLITQHEITGFNFFVAMPEDDFKDIDECLKGADVIKLPRTLTLFEWLITRTDLKDADAIYARLIPAIAAVPVAIKRDSMAQQLAAATGISVAAILLDVDRIRNRSYEERLDRIMSATDKYQKSASADPDNISAALANHERDLAVIEADYNRNTIGVNYQLSRFDALQDLKRSSIDRSEFKFGTYTLFGKALGGGMPYTYGTLIFFGGRSNSGKTAMVNAIGLDVAINDPDTIVIVHTTDDPYSLIEPRLMTNTAFLLSGQQKLEIGEAATPIKGFNSSETSSLYNKASMFIRSMIGQEKLIIIDGEDGSTLTVLERTVKYARNKYPTKKILIVADNIYNYSDFPNLEPTPRMTRITDLMKGMAIKHQACVFATAEYRKNMPLDTSKLKLPVNDDLADARALMYRSNAIVHVYNDFKDRGDFAEIFWVDPFEPDVKKPRLSLLFGKNKISGFADKLIVDLDPKTVTLVQRSRQEVESEWSGSSTRLKDGKLLLDTEYNADSES